MKKEKNAKRSTIKQAISRVVLKGPKENETELTNVWCPTLLLYQPKRPNLVVDQLPKDQK